MDYIIGFLILAVFLAIVVFLVLDKYQSIRKRSHLGLPRKAPVTDDCIWQARKMASFIHDRLKDTGADPLAEWNSGQKDTFQEFCKGRGNIVDLVRYAHLAGCHITIEQVADRDIENPRNTPEALKKYHTDLKRSRAERMSEKYSG